MGVSKLSACPYKHIQYDKGVDRTGRQGLEGKIQQTEKYGPIITCQSPRKLHKPTLHAYLLSKKKKRLNAICLIYTEKHNFLGN